MLFALRPKLLLIAIIFALCHHVHAQKSYPKDYFQPPLDIRLLLSGTFGEIRANHFHSGIDIKTGGVEGEAVYAVADGYVSRIKVSAFGYGNAFYITHPNGYVSVYGHLSRYNKAIEDYVRKAQYFRESFEIELFPVAEELPVKKGEIVAYSGNSGSSGGPHLHFEIRDGASQKPINPLLFGIEVKDFFKPKITSIKIYPEDENAKVNGANKAIRYLTEGWGTEHKLAGSPPVRLGGNISFAIQVYDQQNDTDNKNGPYSVELYIDDKLVYQCNMETFSFDETRYVNSLLDYPEYIRNSVRLQRTKIDPGNRLSIYGKAENHGIFSFNDTLQHMIRYEVKDVEGNMAVLAFKVKSDKPAEPKKVSDPASKYELPSSTDNRQSTTGNFNYATPNYYNNGSIIIDAPRGVFYESFTFRYDSAGQVKGTYSPVHRVHDKYTPIHDYISLSIKPVSLPEGLRAKALIVKINEDGKGFSSVGGDWETSGYVTAKIREFGDYSTAVDTIPPKVNSIQPETFAKMSGQKKVKLTITDELSGIAGYRGTLNGKWILMEYDAKNNLLYYNIDENLLPGKNNFLLEVRDGKNNRAYYSAIFNL